MNDKKQHKFYNKYESTYYAVFRMRFEPIVDLTKLLIDRIGKDEALDSLKNLSSKKAAESIKQNFKNKPIRNFEEFKNIFLEQMKSQFMQNCTTFEVVENTNNKLKFKITECLWAKAFNDLNNSEIGYCSSCYPDFAMAKAYNKQIKLTRTKTIMQGDDHCDHTYTWEE